MRKRYRAELAGQISPAETSRASSREHIDAEPKPARMPTLRVGAHVWFIDTNTRWYELEVVSRRASSGRAVTFKSVTGWDAAREVEWPYGDLFEFPVHSALFKRLRRLSARK